MRCLHPWPIFPTNLDSPTSRSLSIQFILAELIDTLELLKKLEKKSKNEERESNIVKELIVISKELEKFLLFSPGNSFVQKGSVIDKLCFYCEILLQASHSKGSDIPAILEEMRSSVLAMKTKLIACKKRPHLNPLHEILDHLITLYADLKAKLRIFFEALTPFLKESRSDENVLIFLLEKKESFNSHLGSRRIDLLLIDLFPAGEGQLRAVVHEGYTRRGFTSFYASIEPLIESIDWETSCHPTLIG